MSIQELRIKEIDSQGQERTKVDKVRSAARGYKNFSADYTAAAVPITLLDASTRDKTKQDFIFDAVIIRNDEAGNRDYDFYDGAVAGGKWLFRCTVLAQSMGYFGEEQIGEHMFANDDVYCAPQGAWANGSRVSLSGLCVNKEVID